MSDAVWLAIIGVFAMAVKEYFDHLRAQQAADRTEQVKVALANKTEAVKVALEEKTEAAKVALEEKVAEVHRATNGMKEELVAEVRAASFAAGVKSETDKQPAAPPKPQHPPKP